MEPYFANKLQTVLELLSGGNPKSLGKSAEVVEIIIHDADAFGEVFNEMLKSEKAYVRLRAADALEKACRFNPQFLQSYKAALLSVLPNLKEPTIIWHMALLLGYLELEEDEQALAVNMLYNWLDNISHRFVKVNCLQTLAVLALKHDWLRSEVMETLQAALEHDSPSIRARARILLKKFSGKKR